MFEAKYKATKGTRVGTVSGCVIVESGLERSPNERNLSFRLLKFSRLRKRVPVPPRLTSAFKLRATSRSCPRSIFDKRSTSFGGSFVIVRYNQKYFSCRPLETSVNDQTRAKNERENYNDDRIYWTELIN